MLKKHEACELSARKRNLVLPNLTVIQTLLLALFLWGASVPLSTLTARSNPNPQLKGIGSEMYMEKAQAKVRVKSIQFQLSQSIDPGGYLTVTEISPWLLQSGYTLSATVASDGITVNVIIQGDVPIPNESWALVQVFDASDNLVENYSVCTLGGLTGVSDLEH